MFLKRWGKIASPKGRPSAAQLRFFSFGENDSYKFKSRSKRLTGDIEDKASVVKTTAARANLRAAGWNDADMLKPVIAVGVPYSNALPCNNHLLELSEIVCETIEKHGGKAVYAGTPVASDETNGSDGMRYSLPSREIIELYQLMYEDYMCDAMITVSGCDKTVPERLCPCRVRTRSLSLFMVARLCLVNAMDVTIHGGKGLDGKDLMEAIGAFETGKMTQETIDKIERNALPGSGTCSAMFTVIQ